MKIYLPVTLGKIDCCDHYHYVLQWANKTKPLILWKHNLAFTLKTNAHC